jgi:hypothetical protein
LRINSEKIEEVWTTYEQKMLICQHMAAVDRFIEVG